MKNFFADRLFDTFDIKKNGVIEFDEFVRSLSVFHPDAPESDKIEFMFRLYDLKHNGFIERDELKEMVLALLREMNVDLADDAVDGILNKTILDADLNGDGKIDLEEWKTFGDHSSVSKLRDTYDSPESGSNSISRASTV
ncbi:hypothetical protein M8C21_010918, partial [Ambrosia artemisiifolia]